MTEFTLAHARDLDANDATPSLRDRFHVPQRADGQDTIYLCGNSLGLQPKATADYVTAELDAWAKQGVNGHFEGAHPWLPYHEFCAEAAAHIVGAKTREVVMMNALTVNLHLLTTSFYRPTRTRYRIVIEANAFPSDAYAMQSQAALQGYDDAVVDTAAFTHDGVLDEDAFVAWIREEGASVALIMMGGVNYLSGQCFDMARITREAQSMGCKVGFDLAHAVGNVPLSLHDWGVDFAVWCSYKYLNSGPGGVGGAFVHERHDDDPPPRLAGWWGNDPKTRFTMPDRFIPQAGAAGWQLSNAPVLALAAFRASGDLFLEVGMPALRAKALRLGDYLLTLLDARLGDAVDVLTPRASSQRGCQLSLRVHGDATTLQSTLEAAGVISDFRPPNIVRVAPTPLYNTFEDVWTFVEILTRCTSGGVAQ